MVISTLSLTFLLLAVSVQAQTTCSNYGATSTTNTSQCICPPGFLQETDCLQPQCGGNLLVGGDNQAPLSTGTSGLRNVTAGSCNCDDGWDGPVCSVCQSDQACTSLFPSTSTSSTSPSISIPNNSNLTCSSSSYTYASSQLLCNVRNPTVQAVFAGKSELGITRIVSRSGAPVLSGREEVGENGTVYAQLWYDGVEQFNCKATSCTQSPYVNTSSTENTTSTFTCSDLSCFCIPGTNFCTQLAGTINTLSGELEIACSSPPTEGGTGSCTFSQSLLKSLFPPNGLQLVDCQFGECVSRSLIGVVQGLETPVISSVGKGDGLGGGVIAGLAVVGAILGSILGLIGWGFLVQKKARRQVEDEDTLLGRKKGKGAGVTWDKVTYHLSSTPSRSIMRSNRSSQGKLILDNISGKIEPGTMCCVLGPSGAGKSTFVDILAGRRKRGGKVGGHVGFWGTEGEGKRKYRIGFVDQEDVLNPTSTVRETLTFAARLRLGENIPERVKQERVFQVLQDLGLVDVADVRIGDGIKRGVSGGERRRVSIGVELVAAPDILILDEPTSGLDSVSAAKVVNVLQNLARNPDCPTTIIASIHQPSSRLYQSFDMVLLLSQGKQLYFGKGGHSPAEWFGTRGFACPADYNVADHLLEIASSPVNVLDRIQEEESNSRSDSTLAYPEKGSGRIVETPGLGEKGYIEMESIPTLNATASASASSSEERGSRRTADDSLVPVTFKISHQSRSTFLTQIQVLSGREWKNLQRDWSLLITHIATACILGVFAGGLYYKVDLSIAGFQNRVGSLFFLGSLIAFSTLSALYNLMSVRGLFLRERSASFYSPLAWLLSRALFDIIPLRIIPTILVSTIVYFMVGLDHSAARFFKFLLILVEYGLALTLFNFLLASILPNGGIAILLSSLHNLFLMTYAGFFVNLDKIPPVLRWLRWFDVLGYALEAMVVNEVGAGLEIVDTLAGVPVQISATLIMDTLFGFGLGHYYRNVLVLFAFIAGYGALLVGVVWFWLKESR